MWRHHLAILLSRYPPATHFSECFQSSLRRCSPGLRKEDPGLAMEDSGFKPKLSLPAGCLWTVAPSALCLSVPICRMRKDDWLILLFKALGTNIKTRVGGAVLPMTNATEPTAPCHEKEPLPVDMMSRGLQPTVQEVHPASCWVGTSLTDTLPSGPTGLLPCWPG